MICAICEVVDEIVKAIIKAAECKLYGDVLGVEYRRGEV